MKLAIWLNNNHQFLSTYKISIASISHDSLEYLFGLVFKKDIEHYFFE